MPRGQLPLGIKLSDVYPNMRGADPNQVFTGYNPKGFPIFGAPDRAQAAPRGKQQKPARRNPGTRVAQAFNQPFGEMPAYADQYASRGPRGEQGGPIKGPTFTANANFEPNSLQQMLMSSHRFLATNPFFKTMFGRRYARYGN